MKQKPRITRIISILLAVGLFLLSNLGIGILPAMALVKDGSSMSPPTIPAAWHPLPFADKTTSEVTQTDPETEQTYDIIGFDAETSTDLINLTSAEVLEPVFNEYIHPDEYNKPKVIGYYTDWSQYDGRLDSCLLDDSDQDGEWDADFDNDGDVDYYDQKMCAGRGYDLAKVDPLAYDEIILGFLGICGDTGGKAGAINAACAQMDYSNDQVTFIDLWGDIVASRNNKYNHSDCSATGSEADMYQSKIEDGISCGVLGGLYKLQQEAQALGHDLELAFSIGGWSMSGPFSGIVADQNRRQTFIESIGEVFTRFPMFDQVDIDWEYPGDPGIGNPYSPQDGDNYASLIGELRQYLNSHGMSEKKINIAASAVPEKLEKSNLDMLFLNGLNGINVMTYDFFGGDWAPVLAHHTNLGTYDSGAPEEKDINSVQKAVEYLQGLPFVDMRNVYIGYGGYTRNALNANITSQSPLLGTYEAPNGDAIGTFERLSSEYNDVLYNYFDPENLDNDLDYGNKNGYHLYTDAVANADYLYSDTSNVFISLDTPRSVYAKGKYAEQQNLGGIFTWTIDQDAGLLVNAAREGAGYLPINQEINMSDFYFCGENIDPATCDAITYREVTGIPESVAQTGTEEGMTTTTINIKVAGPLKIDIDRVLAP